jgi:hypothetical protein
MRGRQHHIADQSPGKRGNDGGQRSTDISEAPEGTAASRASECQARSETGSARESSGRSQGRDSRGRDSQRAQRAGSCCARRHPDRPSKLSDSTYGEPHKEFTGVPNPFRRYCLCLRLPVDELSTFKFRQRTLWRLFVDRPPRSVETNGQDDRTQPQRDSRQSAGLTTRIQQEFQSG